MVVASLLAACTADHAGGPTKPVVSVSVVPLSSPLPVGTTLQLTAIPKDDEGNPLSGRTVTWSSSDSAVAAITAGGLASGVTLGSANLTATVEGIRGAGSVTVTPGAAARLDFTSQPTTLVAGTPNAAPFVVTARDVGGNVATGFSGSVTVSLASNPTGATLLGTTTEAAVAGVATFTDLHIDKTGSGYTLQAVSASVTGATSAPLTIGPAQAATLVFTVQPGAVTAGSSVPIQVEATDQFGNVEPSFADSVMVAIGTNPGGGTLSGTTRVLAMNGSATFANLQIDRAGAGYTLTATTASLPSATSTGFTVSAATPSATVSSLAVSPATITSSSGSSSTTITATVRDTFGNPVPGVVVTLAATGLGNSLTQPIGPSNALGVAQGSLSSTVSEQKIVSAKAGALSLAQADTVTVMPASGGALFFTVQPSLAVAGSTITPAVAVTAKDPFGNVNTAFTGTVNLTIADNPGGGTLGGTVARAAVAGVATFDDLQIDKSGSGYALTAAATGMTAGKSTAFNINPGPVSASQTTVTALPSPITASTGSSAATITVTARDAAGNPIANATVQLAATGTGFTLVQPGGTTNAAGAASGSLSATIAGDKTISATVNGVAITAQPVVTVNAAAATGAQTTIAAAPTSIAASNGGFTSTITVTAKDAFGNVVSGATVGLAAAGGGNAVVQPAGPTNALGVATGTVSSTLVGAKTVSATVNGVPVTATAAVTVVPGEVSVSQSTIVAVADTITASTGTSVDTFTITARDDQGNVIPGVPVVLGSTGSSNVIGQPTMTDGSGVAKGTLRSAVAEDKIVSATIDGTGIDQVDTITVKPAAPAGLAFVVQPSNATGGVTMSPAVQVEIRDGFANRVTTAANTVTLALNMNPASLSGNGPIAAVNGVAAFPNLTVNTSATGYTLAASSAGLAGTVSGTFNVSTGVVSASQSTVAVSPSSLVAGVGSSTITVTVKDGSGTPLPGVTVTLTASGGNSIVQPAGLTNGSGVAQGSLSSTSAGIKTVTATASGVVINQKPTITVTAGAISGTQSSIQANPTTVVVNSPSSILVTAKDQFGNPVSGATVDLDATGSGVTVTQPSAATDATGAATGSVKASNTGTVTVSATAGGVALTQTASVTVEAVGSSVVFIGAGDISDCANDNDAATAALINAMPSAPVFTLGDNAYPNGSSNDYKNCYNPTWGAFKSRTHPSAGNHEYDVSSTAAPYFAYFGAAAGTAGQGYYSFDLGSWHVVVLNSNIATDVGSPQELWLKADLAAHPNVCTLAYWHHPLYSSIGGSTGTSGAVITSARPLWDDLYAAGADLVLNGHRHVYERLAPMKPDGSPDPVTGIRTIIAGMGGESGGDLTNIFPTSEVREGRTFGILKLTLTTGSYSWQFIGVPGSTFTDSGTNSCH
ncbi:MAG TPA: Ig-like domain-containing protein [Gemmatimonadales bacterium]|nr:Ig-like domain-containing protein [Gemmatimonadales bacterium]